MLYALMYLIPTLATLFAYYKTFKAKEKGIELHGPPVITAACSAFFVAICILLPADINFNDYSEVLSDQVMSDPIASLRTGNDYKLYGSFFLGCGTVQGYNQERYYFMYDLGNNTYQKGWVITDHTLLQESATLPPQFQYHHKVYGNTKGYFWWPKSLRKTEERDENYKLIIPPHTVVQRFQVD